MSYSYDAAGNRLSMTTPAGTIYYSYDGAGQLASVTDPSGAVSNYSYDAAGLRTQLVLPNGVTIDYGYDALDRLTSIDQHLGTATLASYAYTLDPAGNRLSVSEADGSSIQWTYDDAYRLASETRRDGSNAVTYQAGFTYDAVGNRLTQTVSGVATQYTYNDLDQLLTAGVAQYQYDGRGNLARVTDGADVTQYSYDAADRLSGVTLPDGTAVAYTYDAAGRRVRQSVAAQVTNYLWDEISPYGDVVLETDGGGSTLASYALGGTELLSQTRGGVMSYYLHDGQGSTRALSDDSGAATDTFAYTAFGELYAQAGPTTNAYLYTGQQFDALTGLYSLRARYYVPAIGRFLSQDTAYLVLMAPAEIDRYVYTANNPINAVDPGGLQAFVEYSEANQTSQEESAPLGNFSNNLVNEYNYSSLGQWETASESMSARAASYQAQIAGKSGEIFRLNGVKFDGFNNGVLMEAKGPGYANFIENGEFRTWFQGARGLVEQAYRQITAAQGIPIEWHVAEIAAANLIRYILVNAGYDTIKVIFTPIP